MPISSTTLKKSPRTRHAHENSTRRYRILCKRHLVGRPTTSDIHQGLATTRKNTTQKTIGHSTLPSRTVINVISGPKHDDNRSPCAYTYYRQCPVHIQRNANEAWAKAVTRFPDLATTALQCTKPGFYHSNSADITFIRASSVFAAVWSHIMFFRSYVWLMFAPRFA